MRGSVNMRRQIRSAERAKHKALIDAIHAENQKIVDTGKCPECGSALRYNSSIAGWWQCSCYGVLSSRPAEYKNSPKCEFQCFTE